MSGERYDLAIIGGGVNGCGIARDAAGRGLSVILAEAGDLAGGTSSASTKLIHGGLRYLEHYAFRLVRESLAEREVLLRMAPHIVRPLRFVLPHHRALRPRALLRAGLFLYDHLGGRKLLPPTRVLDLRGDPAGKALRPSFSTAFEYSDCWVDDARLVVLNAVDARERGAEIRTRTRVVRAVPDGASWRIRLRGAEDGEREIAARVLVNAAGPWAAPVEESVIGRAPAVPVRLVKGSHIVVDRASEDPRAFIFQNGDGRIVFAIPYETDFTLIGTTDVDFTGDPADAAASEAEIDYLLQAVGDYLRVPVPRSAVRRTFAGVRPLLDTGGAAKDATRDYLLALEGGAGRPALLTVHGGKITTYRRLAEAALAKLAAVVRVGRAWTGGSALPGGEFPVDGRAALAADLASRYRFLDARTAGRLAGAYGTRARRFLGTADRPEALGRDFGCGLSEAEIDYLADEEFAITGEDVLWRRSKLGLRLGAAEAEAVARHMEERARRAGEGRTA